MAQDLSKLIGYLQSQPTVVRNAAPSGESPLAYSGKSSFVPQSTGTDLMQGAGNIFMGLMRGITAGGRAVTNTVSGALPAFNEAGKLAQGGLQTSELGDYAGTIWNGFWGGLGGAAKGLAYSFMPPTQQSRKQLTDVFGGAQPVEGMYDILKSDTFKETLKTNPELTGLSSETTLGTTPGLPFSIPFLGIEAGVGMPITPAGLYSFAWDAGTDPASWMTLGVGGALKGTVSGVAKGTKVARLKKEFKGVENIPAEEISKVGARPFYKVFRDGAWQDSKKLPIVGDAAYNAANTNPFLFMGKETIRGFSEAHKYAADVTTARRFTRLARKNGDTLFTQATKNVTERGGDVNNVDEIFKEIDTLAEDLAKNQDSKLKVAKDSAEAVARIREGETAARLAAAEHAKSQVPFASERAARLAAQKEALSPERAAIVDRANEARKITRTVKNFENYIPKVRPSKNEPELVNSLADNFSAAQGAEGANISSAWNAFADAALERGNTGAIKSALRDMFAVVGHREFTKGSVLEADPKKLSQLLRRDSTRSAEMAKLKGLIKTDVTRRAPKATAGKGVAGSGAATDDAINQAIEDGWANLGGSAQRMGDEFEATLDSIVANIEQGQNFGEELAKALGGNTRVFAERLRYAAERDVSTTSPEVALIEGFMGKKGGVEEYNPYTIQIDQPTISSLPTASTRNAARALTLLNEAGGDAYNAELAGLLKMAGIKRVGSTDKLINLALDTAHASLFLKGLKGKAQMSLKVFNTRLGKLNLNEYLGPEVKTLTEETFPAFEAQARRIAPSGENLTDAQLRRMVELAGIMKNKQLDANAELLGNFSIPLAGNGAQLRVLGNTDQAQARRIAQAGLERYAPTKSADEIGRINGAFGDVQTKIGFDAEGNLNLAKALKDVAATVSTPQGQKLVVALRDYIYKKSPVDGKLRSIKIPKGNEQLIKEVKRDIGNLIAEARKGLPLAGIPGFSEIFTTTRGGLKVSTISNFMTRAYVASRSSLSRDGGRFADYVDEVFLGGRELPENWAGKMSVAERTKILRPYADKWGGEGLTPVLLLDVRDSSKKIRSGAGKATAAEKARFVKDVEEIVDRAKDAAARNLATTDEFKTFDSSSGWLSSKVNAKKKGERKLTDAELTAAREAYFSQVSREISEADWEVISTTFKRMYENEEYGILQESNLIKVSMVDGKEVIDTSPLKKALRGRGMTGQIAYAILQTDLPVKGTVLGRIIDEVVRLGQREAEAAVTAMRANTLMSDVWPASATPLRLNELPSKLSIDAAYTTMQAEMLLAKATSTQDALVARGNEATLRSVRRSEKEVIAREKKRFDETLRKVDKKLSKAGHTAVSMADAAAMTFDEVIATGNPRTLLRHIPSMKTLTDQERRNWREAMRVLLDLGEEGNKSIFKSPLEAIDAWKAKSPEISDEDMLKILAAYGSQRAASFINKGKTPKRDTILRYVNDSTEMIEQAELQRLRDRNVYAELGMGTRSAAEIKTAVDKFTEADSKEMVDALYNNLVNLISTAEESGNGWLADLAIGSLGDSVDMFFRLTENVPLSKKGIFKIEPRKAGDPSAIKPTREILTQYTEFKGIVDGIRQKARDLYPGDSLSQDTFVSEMTIRALRIRENYYMLRGVVPAATPMRSRGAAENAMFDNPLWKTLDDGVGAQPIFLSDADVLEALDPKFARDVLFLERSDSMPYSSVMEGARVLVAHMERLEPGAWFNDTEYQTVYLHMYQNMIADARKSFDTNSKGGGSWFDRNIDANELRIRGFIEYFLSSTADDAIEAPAFRLFEQHRRNAIYASVVGKYVHSNGRILGPLRDAWGKAMASNIMSAGDKVAATADAMSSLNDFLDLNNISEDIPKFLARYDQLLLMSSWLDREAVLSVALHTEMKKAAQDTAEMAGIKAVQKKSKQMSQAQKAATLNQANARTDLVLDTLAQKEMAIRKQGLNPDVGDMIDQVNDTMTDGGFINTMLNLGDRVLTRFSWNYKMEDIRKIYGGIAREAIAAESNVTKANVMFATRWREVAKETGVNHPQLAMESLGNVPDNLMADVIDKLETIYVGFHPNNKGKLDLDTAAKVADDLDYLKNLMDAEGNRIFPDLDDVRASALSDVAAMLFHIFGDNGKFAMQRAPAGFLNTLLRKVGADTSRIGFNSNLSPDSLGGAWKEMEFDDVFNELNALHFAFQETEKLRNLGVEAMRVSGARKINDFGSLKEAEAAGYFKMKTVDELKGDSGTEVIFFMDTDNYVYPAAMIDQIRNFSNFVSLPYRGFGAEFAKKMKRFSRLQDFAKQNMTTLRPGNYVMNAIGAGWINDVAGLRNPLRYAESAMVMRSLGVAESDLGISMSKLRGSIDSFQQAGKETGEVLKGDTNALIDNLSSHKVIVKGKAVTLDAETIGKAYVRIGGKLPHHQSMQLDLLTEVADMDSLQKVVKSTGIKKAYGELTGFTGKIAAQRDDYFRMALFLDHLQKGNWNSLEEAFRESLNFVDRYHPQPQDLSKGNYIVTRQAILFFTWRAKTLGLLLGELMDRPGRLLTYEKAYYNFQAGQGNQPEAFGSHDPQDTPVRSFQQNTMGLLTADNQYSFSVANPMWDLMGSDGWLSNIKWDQNQSPAANALNIGFGTSANLLYSATPLLGNFVVNWAQGRTANGTDLMRGGISNEDLPLVVSDVANAFGLNAYHATAAYFFPGIVDKGTWKDLTPDEKSQELMRTWFNWATGARASKYLTPDNQKKAYSEYKSLLGVMAKRNAPTESQGPGQGISDLIGYLGSLGGSN